MSATTQNIFQVSTEIDHPMLTWQDFKKTILDILRAGIFYRRSKDKAFMSWYKRQLDELKTSEDPETYIYEKVIEKFLNEEIYNRTMEDHKGYYKNYPKVQKAIKAYYILYYTIVKDTFATEEELDKEFNSWINS